MGRRSQTDGNSSVRLDRGESQMNSTLRAFAPHAMACVTAALVAGCAATVPEVTASHVAASEAPKAPPAPRAAEVVAPSTDERVAKLAARYYGIEATIEGLVTDVQGLDAGQTALQTDLRAIEGRITAAEDRVISLTEKILARFDSFESQVTDLRDAIAQRPAPPVAEAPISTQDVIAAVKGWRSAWQTGLVSEYMDWYHPEASVTRVSVVKSGAKADEGLGLDELRRRVERLRARYTRVDVAIADVQVSHDGARIVARFQQDFAAWAGDRRAKPSYTDTGTKTLVFVRVGGDLRVIQESWTPAS